MSRESLIAVLRLAELGLSHAGGAVMAGERKVIEQIRSALADTTDELAAQAAMRAQPRASEPTMRTK